MFFIECPINQLTLFVSDNCIEKSHGFLHIGYQQNLIPFLKNLSLLARLLYLLSSYLFLLVIFLNQIHCRISKIMTIISNLIIELTLGFKYLEIIF